MPSVRDLRVETIRVLHVDDDPEFADVAATFVERENERVSVETATSATDGMERLAEGAFDCVVSDYDMPGQDGIAFLETVRESYPDLPFILYTGKGSEEVASEAISAGVTDYLQKSGGTSQYAVLANRIANAVDQYRSKREIEASRKRLSLFFDQSPLGVIEWTEEFTFARVNERAEAILGYAEEELLGESWELIVPASDRESVAAVVADLRHAEGGYHSVNENVRKDGERITCEWHNHVVTDCAGEVVAIFSKFRDITERTEREAELQRKERRYQAVFNDPNILVGLIDTDGGILDINQTAMDYVGATREAITGDPFWEAPWFGHSERVQREVREWVDRAVNGEYVGFETALVRPDGDPYMVEGVVRPVIDDGGTVVSLLVSARDVTERKERERELRRYEAYLEEATDIITVVDDAGTITYESPAVERVLGYDPGELIGRDGFEFVHPDDVEGTYATFSDLVSEPGATMTVECRFRTADGGWRWLEIRGTNQLDNDAINGIVANSRDITDRKERERELREEQEFVGSIFRSLPDPLYAFDTDGYPIRWNEEFEAVTGYTGEEIEDMHLTEFVPADEADAVAANLRTILDERRAVAVESAVETKDGDRIPYEFTGGPLDGADGSLRGVTGIGRDIAERTGYEQRLKALNETAHELIGVGSREAVAEIGVRTASNLLGLEASAIHLYDGEASGLVPVAVTDAVYDVVGEPPTFTGEDSIAWRVYREGEALALDDVREDPDIYNPDTPARSELYLPLGEYGVLIATSPRPATFDEEDLLLGEILAGGLVTALEQVERTEQLHARERELVQQNDRLQEFASVVSHDLRNPLNAAEVRLELASEECDSEHLTHVGRAHDRMGTLIDDLLALAREGAAVTGPEPVDLAALARNCWGHVETADASLVIDTDRTVLADESRLKQLFENLVRNAVEHGSTGPRSRTREDAGRAHSSEPSVADAPEDAGRAHSSEPSVADAPEDAAERDGSDVTVTVGELADGFYVEDDGPGIPEDDREDVFTAGYSTSQGGTGFGLSIVEQIAEAHGWEIRITDGPQGGARFEITGVDTVDG